MQEDDIMEFVCFQGAYTSMDDNGKKTYHAIGPVTISVQNIVAFYDHTICTPSNKIRVMESYKEIKEKLQKE